MNALVYEGPREMNCRELPVPEAAEDEVVIRVDYVGICGSELSGYLGKNSLRVPPLVMGHEFSGTVAEIGSRVTRFQLGDTVTANPLVTCGRCEACESGHAQLCSNRKLLGAHLPGAFAQYVAVPEQNVFLLPAGMTLEEAVFTEPFACGVHICRISRASPSDNVLITGAGPIGLFALQAAKLFGVEQIVVTDLNEERLKIVEELGGIPVHAKDSPAVFNSGSGFDIAIDAVGTETTRNVCMGEVKPGGRVVFSGLHESDSRIPINQAIRNEIQIKGAFAYSPNDFRHALQWMGQGRIRMTEWTDYLPLDQGRQGFETLLTNPGKTAKIVLKPTL